MNLNRKYSKYNDIMSLITTTDVMYGVHLKRRSSVDISQVYV